MAEEAKLTAADYVHLHNHTHYSLLDGLTKVDELVAFVKKTGMQATVIGIVQAVVATLFVDAALIVTHFIVPDKLSMSAALTLGAIAAATAPAATLMVTAL